MSEQLNLKEIERKAFRSTYQDGLWDIYYGIVVAATAIFVYRPEEGYSSANILILIVSLTIAYILFWAGKRFITMPRMGQVRFGPQRKKRKRMLAMTLAVVVLFQAAIVSLTTFGWLNPEASLKLNAFLKAHAAMDVLVASIGALFVGVGMSVNAYFNDFPRGYYIAVMMSLAVFLMIWLNQPVYPIILGGLIALPGIVLLVKFLGEYPIPPQVGSVD